MGLRFGIKEMLSFWGLVDNVAEGERNCVTGGDVFWVMGWWCVIGLSCLHRHERYAFGVYLLFLFLLYRVTEWERERATTELVQYGLTRSRLGFLISNVSTIEVDISEVFSFCCFGWGLDFLDRHVWIIFVTIQ